MSGRKRKSGMIKLLKFDVDESLDPKTLFDGAKLTMKEPAWRKSSFNEKWG